MRGARVSESQWRVPLSDVLVDEDLVAAARDALESGWWSMGPRVQAFEAQFSELTGSPHALAVANGTTALHLALLALDCGPGDEVVLPALNFVAAANVVVRVGATPVFCDVVGPTDLNLDPEDLERAIGPRTKAVIVLHYGGYACDVDAALQVAERHGVAVVEDAAHAPGATLRGQALGTFGVIGCFSFFSNKNVPIGEGGMVVTADDALATRLGLLRSHGMTTLTWQRHSGHASTYDVLEPGFNYRMDEIRAALAMVQLERLPAANAARARHAARYRELLDGREGLSFPFVGSSDRGVPSHHLAVVLLPPDVSRDGVRGQLQEERIQTSVHYPPIHRFSAYAAAGAARPLPMTDEVAPRIVSLPLYSHMSPDDVQLVSDALGAAVRAQR
jgi:dTDP-4-amino-4,6-dideoxygalactose transaminase